MDQPINKLHISARLKEVLLEMGFTNTSDLDGYDFFSPQEKFPDCYYFDMIMKELIPLGYLKHPEGEASIYEIPLLARIKNVFGKRESSTCRSCPNTPEKKS